MDENGHCFPSQALLAKDLGISRQHANKRIQRLLAFRFNDHPILTVAKNRENKRGGSRWANNVYQLRPITGFAIFDESNALSAGKVAGNTAESSVSLQGDIELPPTSVSPSVSPLYGDTRKGDTNQNQYLNKTLNVNDLSKAPNQEEGTRSPEEHIRIGSLVIEILEVCRDPHSRGFYRLLAEKLPTDLIRAALSETKYQATIGRVKKSRGAFFTDEVTRLAKQQGIDLGLETPSRPDRIATGR